jgi:hypothetical protein
MTLIGAAFFILVLLQIKHWYIDFVDQTMEEVRSKGIYGDEPGIMHSAKHGFGTLMCILAVTGFPYIGYAMVLAFTDFVIHYHTDWAKMNYGNRDIQNPLFWNHLGLDQMVHQLTYLGIVYAVVS